MGGKFKFSAQDRDLEYFFGGVKSSSNQNKSEDFAIRVISYFGGFFCHFASQRRSTNLAFLKEFLRIGETTHRITWLFFTLALSSFVVLWLLNNDKLVSFIYFWTHIKYLTQTYLYFFLNNVIIVI